MKIFLTNTYEINMSEQICKGCSHELKFHYKSQDRKTYCSKCNLKGRDCYTFDE